MKIESIFDQQSNAPMTSHCLSRITGINERRYFADQVHKFFLEMRCGRPCDGEICDSCSEKSPTSVIQWCRKIDHGTIHDPIPDRSHLFGGTWYQEGVRKWGEPSEDSLRVAMDYQIKARLLLTNENVPSKVPVPSQAMEKGKRGRKPKVAMKPIDPPNQLVIETRVEETPIIPSPAVEKATTEPVKKAPVKRKPKAAMLPPPTMIHKEVVLPTHIEKERDQVDIDGFEIEYIRLSVYTVDGITYFRDSKKNKLYKKIKEKTVGEYVGRYDPVKESIHHDVPDSDEE